MFKKFMPLYLFALVALSLAFIYGCGAAPTGGGGGTSGGETTYFGTQSGGDTWKWVIGSSTFSGKNLDKDFSFSGTYETKPSGFRKAYISSVEGAGGPSVGDQAYFLEFPNTMLLVKPTHGNGGAKVIVCGAAASTAPTSDNYNFINIPKNNWDDTGGAFGTAESSFSGNSYTFEVWNRKMNNTTDNHTVEGGWVFENGYFSRPGVSKKIFVAPSGIFCGDNGTGEGGFVGAVADHDNFPDLDTAKTAVIGKQFRGVLFKYNPVLDSGETQTVGATGEANGTIHGGGFMGENIDTSAEADYTNQVTIELTGLTNGLASGTLDDDGGKNTMHLMLAKIGSKIMVFGISTNETGSAPDTYNFLVIEQ